MKHSAFYPETTPVRPDCNYSMVCKNFDIVELTVTSQVAGIQNPLMGRTQ